MGFLRQFSTYLLVLCLGQPAFATPAASAATHKAPHKPTASTPAKPASTELPSAETGKAYKYTIHFAMGSATATSPFTFAPGGGALPACLQMTTQGVVSGTPDAKCVGTYRFVVFVTSNNGEQADGTYLIHVNEGGENDKNKDRVESPEGQADVAVAESLPDCGLLITSVLPDGATEIKGVVSKEAIDEDSLIAFCRSPYNKPQSCMSNQDGRPDARLFEALAGDNGYYVSPKVKTGTFSATLLVPLAYGDSLNALLVRHKQCVERPFGVEATKTVTEAKETEKPKKTVQSDGPKRVPKHEAEKPSSKATSALQTSPEIIAPLETTQSSPSDKLQPKVVLTAASISVAASEQPAAALDSRRTAGEEPGYSVAMRQVESGSTPRKDPEETPSSPTVAAGTPAPEADAQRTLFPPASPTAAVMPGTDWGRIRATFVLGILLANDNSQLSSAHQFYDFLLEKYWALPGCYLYDASAGYTKSKVLKAGAQSDNLTSTQCGHNGDPRSDHDGRLTAGNWFERHHPGLNTYFETRLTAIPVSSNTKADSSTNTGTAFLTTQKTARVAVGVDLPFLVTRWDWRYKPNALFLAPIAKTGFDTLTGALTQTVVGADGAPTPATYERLYNYYAFGGRLGHYTLTHSENSAPEWQSFLDVVVGRYSNLESYICDLSRRKPAAKPMPNSQCAATYGALTGAGSYVDSLKRPYRLDFEGALKIPYLPLLLGFNANLGQHAISTGHIDPAFNTPDDLRFLFGTKFDVATFLSKFGLPSVAKQ